MNTLVSISQMGSALILLSCSNGHGIYGDAISENDAQYDTDDHENAMDVDVFEAGDDGGCESMDCGNMVIDECEECDDGNAIEWDGCNQCKIVEFRVNSIWEEWQTNPSALLDNAGIVLIAFQSWDRYGSGVFYRVFDQDGLPLETEIQVNSFTERDQEDVDCAILPNSNIFVWNSPQDGHYNGIVSRIFDEHGAAETDEVIVNTYTQYNQVGAAIGASTSGISVVAWQSEYQEGIGASGSGIYAQMFDSEARPIGEEFHVNTFTSSVQMSPAIAVRVDGSFIIVWASDGPDGDGYSIVAQQFNASGEAEGAEFVVNSYSDGAQSFPSIAVNDEGQFIVVWASEGQDGDGTGVIGQFFNRSGEFIGSQFVVNEYTIGSQHKPEVSIDADSNIAIVWESDLIDGSGKSVCGRLFTKPDMPRSDEFIINRYYNGNQERPNISMDDSGRFVVVWQSEGQDGDGYGVFAQRYDAIATPHGVLPW